MFGSKPGLGRLAVLQPDSSGRGASRGSAAPPARRPPRRRRTPGASPPRAPGELLVAELEQRSGGAARTRASCRTGSPSVARRAGEAVAAARLGVGISSRGPPGDGAGRVEAVPVDQHVAAGGTVEAVDEVEAVDVGRRPYRPSAACRGSPRRSRRSRSELPQPDPRRGPRRTPSPSGPRPPSRRQHLRERQQQEGLGRAGDAGVAVHEQAQQRRARAVHAHEEERRLAAGRLSGVTITRFVRRSSSMVVLRIWLE